MLALAAFICTTAYSVTKTWNGSAWSPTGTPASGDAVIIASGTYSLSANLQFLSLTLSGGSINLGSNTLRVTSAISIKSAGTIQASSLSMLDATGASLTIDGGNLTLNNVEVVVTSLSFVSSHDIISSNSGFLSFDDNTSHALSSVDNTSHVNAKVRLYLKNGNNSIFNFPIGDGTVYSPFIFDPKNVPGSQSNPFQHWVEVTYVGSQASQKGLDLSTLNSASGYEYWITASSSSNVTGTIALRYDNNGTKTGKTVVGSVTNLAADLKLTQYDASIAKWVGIGSTNAANTPSTGITTSTSTSNSVVPTSNWTLASTNARTSFTIALPVNLINFNAAANKNSKSVEVSWSTTNEENNSHFEIMHANDFVNWTSIGTVYSKGNGNDMNVYSFTDINPSNINQYKLKIVALNGEVSYSNIQLVKFTETVSTTVNIYPNPANANVNLSINNMDMSTPVSIQLVNTMGQVVFEQIITENASGILNANIPTSEFAAGIYQLSITNVNGTVSQKLSINH